MRSADLSFYRFILKANGHITTAGALFLTVSLIWIGLNVHSGFVRYNESVGTAAYETVRLPDELALAQSNPVGWLSATDLKNIANGRQFLGNANKIGLFVNSDALAKLAWLEFLSGRAETGADLLGKAAGYQKGQARALSLYYGGAILNRIGSYDQALARLDQALAEAPELTAAREEKGESLWQLGRRIEAVASWRQSLKKNPTLPLANDMLSGAAAAFGQPDTSAAYEKIADRSAPNDPYFQWMLALRLQNLKMSDLAEKHFQRAIQLDPRFQSRRN